MVHHKLPDPDNYFQPSVKPHKTDKEPETIIEPTAPALKSKKIPIIVAVAILLLVGGAAVYFMTKKDTSISQQPSQEYVDEDAAEQVADQMMLENADDFIFYQVNTFLMGYNTKTHFIEDVTESIPDGARILDAYVGADGWRLYYQDNTSSGDTWKQAVYYLENDQTAKQIIESSKYGINALAHAKEKFLAYTMYPGFEDGSSRTTRTYVSRDAGPVELVYESNPYNDTGTKVNPADLKHALYNMQEISPDGSKLLFSRSACYECDGSSPGYFAELDLATKTMSKLDTGTKAPYRSVSYDTSSGSGYLLREYDSYEYYGGMGEYAGFQLKLSRFTSPAKPNLLFTEKNNNWLGTNFSPDMSMVAVNYYKDPTDWQSASFKAIYELKGTNVASSTALPVTVPDGMQIYTVTNKKNDCFLSTTALKPGTSEGLRGVAAICKDGDKYSFSQIADRKEDTTNYIYIKLL